MADTPDPLARTRFTPDAAARLRAAIAEAGGIEVFAIGQVGPDGLVLDLEVHCRGNAESVPALLSRPRPGQVVVHNHPSGVLQASSADMALAALYGEDGVGVVIVDNDVARALWVVEPHVKRRVAVSDDDVRAFFLEALPRAMDGYEVRDGQLEMALQVADALNDGGVVALEAGTGTGKSLAYLAPAVLWAVANDAKVAVATYTIALQGQLVSEDIPVLRRAGLDFRHALLKGRNNYVCRRRLAEAAAESESPDAQALAALAGWAETASEGSRSDIGFPLDGDVWEQVESDHDQTLGARCRHYDRCFYYEARRAAAQANLLVVNQHLLLADLSIKQATGGDGMLPRFDRVVIDEAHHLEDAATGLAEGRLSAASVSRAVGPLLRRGRRPGAAERLRTRYCGEEPHLPPPDRERLATLLDRIEAGAAEARTLARDQAEVLAAEALAPDVPLLRVTPAVERTPLWSEVVAPGVHAVAVRLATLANQLAEVEEILSGVPPGVRFSQPQPLFDLARARRRLGEQGGFAEAFSHSSTERQVDDLPVSWIALDRQRGQGAPRAVLHAAPVEVGPTLRARLFDPLRTVIATSATLTVHGGFDHWLSRVGLAPPPGPPPSTAWEEDCPTWREEQDDAPSTRTAVFPSPFDFRRQALLGLPRDLPAPGAADYDERVSAIVVDALRASRGGAFVLCTSYQALDSLHRRAEQDLGGALPLLRQGQMGRGRLLERFRQTPDAVLFGTDSFWEGVSVKGDALRLVIIPRLPFRVPTEPVQQARYERIEQRGLDPFRHYSLPQAVLRLRQGVGRLIRTQRDRGAVLVLDRRVLDRWYGRVFLASLPDMERATGPARSVLVRLREFFQAGTPADAG